MSSQMLTELQQNSIAALAAIIKRTNLSSEFRQNLSDELAQLERYLRSGKIEMTTDKEFFRTLYGTWESDDYLSDGIKIFFYWIYFIIFVIGISGNVLVCYVFVCNKSMHSVTNLFITNLAVSDILLCLFAVPFTPLYLLTFKAWVFGSILCHLVPYVQGVSVYISALTLMSIAIDRFFVIIYPFKPRMKMYMCTLIIIAIWISAAALTLPYGYFVRIIPSDSPNDHPIYLCDEVWPSEGTRRIFGISTSMLQFVIPVTIIAFCYIRVCSKLSDKNRIIPGAKSARKEEQERERTSRTNRMLISMVIVFGVSWLPLNSYNLVVDFHIQAALWHYSRALFLLSHSIAMSSTCYNPLLYAWLNENFRKEFKSVLPCWRSAQLANANSSRRDNSSFRAPNIWNNTSQRSTDHRNRLSIDCGDHRNANGDFNAISLDHSKDLSVPIESTEKGTTLKYFAKSNSIVMQITNADTEQTVL